MNTVPPPTETDHSDSAPVVAPVVAIDGPAASGKTSVGRAAARALRLRFLDTGIMYRAVTWLALRRGVPLADPAAVGQLAADCLMVIPPHDPDSAAIIIDGHPLREALTTPAVDRNVSAVAAVSAVRAALVRQQRAIAAPGGIVLAGRDIGAVVLPAADLKLYIDASPEERARRRCAQLRESGANPNYRQVLADTRRRDTLDMQRADSPLLPAPDALVINTDGITLAEAIAEVVAAIRAAGKKRE